MMYKRGQKVRIKKGSEIKSTRTQNERISRKTQVVIVHTCYERVPACERLNYPEYPERVVWAGPSGYWCWTNTENVELVSE